MKKFIIFTAILLLFSSGTRLSAASNESIKADFKKMSDAENAEKIIAGNNIGNEKIEIVSQSEFNEASNNYNLTGKKNFDDKSTNTQTIQVSEEYYNSILKDVKSSNNRFSSYGTQYLRYSRNKVVEGNTYVSYGFYATIYSSGSFRNFITVHFGFIEAPSHFKISYHDAYKISETKVKGDYRMGYFYWNQWVNTWSMY